MMKHRKPERKTPSSYLVMGGALLMLAMLMTDLGDRRPKPVSNKCLEVVQSQSVLHRDKLSQLLSIPERSSRDQVKAVISEPYCRLPQIEIRAGVPAEREAYPLAFDPQTWFVVLYEGNEYAGYDFVFKK
ncbi:hypothetical protein [Leptolyngbya sp. O-77]|uniref:hypothetical protein n=1 Tax=Leptolyngbya sp. O-77 TaxID=1080068 RepID=UPI000A02BC1A|nr:hypothetical protein [Leptolyngbya sp. O-77]